MDMLPEAGKRTFENRARLEPRQGRDCLPQGDRLTSLAGLSVVKTVQVARLSLYTLTKRTGTDFGGSVNRSRR
jgi:hypothetical protein